jgi:hypothetical protein
MKDLKEVTQWMRIQRCCRMYANLEKFAHPIGGDQEMSSRK